MRIIAKKVFATIAILGIMSIMLASEGKNVGTDILTALGPLLVLILAPIISRLFKKLGLEIADSAIEPVLMRIIEIIAGVEKEKKELSGKAKKNLVINRAGAILSDKEKKLLLKRYGNLGTAVEAAFQMSNLAIK